MAVELDDAARKVADDLGKLDRAAQMKVVESVMGDHSVCRSMLAATGRLPEPPVKEYIEAINPSGYEELPPIQILPPVQYVVGTPVSTIKALRQPIFDTEFYRSGMCRVSLFSDCRYFADGAGTGKVKTKADTNVYQNGCLGYPLEYDVRWIEIHLSGDPDDIKRLVPTMSLDLIFGCNTPWFRTAVAAMKPLIQLPPNMKLPRRSAKKIADAFAARGHEFGHYWAPVCYGQEGRRLHGVESFRVDIEFSNAPVVNREVRIQVALQDVLYAHL